MNPHLRSCNRLIKQISNITAGEGVGICEYYLIKEIDSLTSPPSDLRSLETYNLINGFKYLSYIIKSSQNYLQSRYYPEFAGLLDVDCLFLDLHKILMNNYKSGGGKFSTLKRFTFYKGVLYMYPHFPNLSVLEDGLLYLVDRINSDIFSIKFERQGDKKLEMIYNCLTKFFFAFLTIHPFG